MNSSCLKTINKRGENLNKFSLLLVYEQTCCVHKTQTACEKDNNGFHKILHNKNVNKLCFESH